MAFDWIGTDRLDWPLRPSKTEVKAMVADIKAAFGGEREAALVLGVSTWVVESWSKGQFPSAGGLRCLWLTWCLVCRPGRLRSVFDLVTWGRFVEERDDYRPTRGDRAKPLGWSGWEI